MPPSESRVAMPGPLRAIEWLFASRGGPWVIAAVVAVAGLWTIHRGDGVNSEGLILAYSSDAFRHAPLAVTFMLRLRPICTVVYALASAAGRDVFLASHLLVAVAALPLLASVARTLGVRWSSLPVVLLATSPAFFWSATGGISTGDGFVAVTLFAWLWVVKRSAAGAGLVLGALPFVRPELGLLTVIAAGWELWHERRRAFLVALAVVPALYLGLGAVYHRDLLWIVHYPAHPSRGAWGKGGIDWAMEAAAVSVPRVAAESLTASPFLGLAIVGAFREPPGRGRALVVFAVALFVVLNVFPFVQLFTGMGGRYLVVVLPFLAIAAARLIEDTLDGAPGAFRAMALGTVLAGAALVASMRHVGDGGVQVLLASMALLLGAVSFGWKVAAALLVVATGLVSRPALAKLDQEARKRDDTRAEISWLASNRGDRVVYTNDAFLAPMLDHVEGRRATYVRFFFQKDVALTLEVLTNPDNGQRAAVRDAFREVNGTTLFPDQVVPESVPDGSVFVLNEDPRLWATISRERFEPRLRRVQSLGRRSIYVFDSAPAAGTL